MVRTPREEGPVGTVPDAGHQEDDEGIADNNPFLVTVRVLD